MYDCKRLGRIRECGRIFRKTTQKKYNTVNVNSAYLNYLESFYDKDYQDPSLDFLLDKGAIDIIERLKNAETFDKVWISLSTAVSEMRDEKGDTILNDPDNKKLVIINKYGDYRKCVKKSSKNHAIKKYVDFEAENPGMSFILSARHLRRELNSKDLNNDLNKLVITLGFYYEYVYMINNYYGE